MQALFVKETIDYQGFTGRRRVLSIIGSGIAKGMNLSMPKGELTRPTSAKVRLAIFNKLQPYIEGSSLLDLFAGSGAIGLEGLSRGAQRADFVEASRLGQLSLNKNIVEFRRRLVSQGIMGVDLTLHRLDVAAFFECSVGAQAYDLVFADPPYAEVKKWLPHILEKLKTRMTENGHFVFESSENDQAWCEDLVSRMLGWALLDQKKYGGTLVSFFCYIGSQN